MNPARIADTDVAHEPPAPKNLRPIGVLFVCHGNICRRAMAQCVMQKLACDRGLADRFRIDSAACRTDEIGSPLYPPAARELARHGVPALGHRARLITAADGDAWDYIVYMDAENERDLARILGPAPAARVCRLMSFTMRCDDVADPWYTGDFAATYDDVLEGCTALIDLLAG